MTQPEQAATPDELAAIYLRARNVPCPGCGYNRRDGLVAACPECAHPMGVRDAGATEAPAQVAALRWIARLLLVAHAVDILATIGLTVRTAMLIGRTPALASAWAGIGVLFALIGLETARRALGAASRPVPDVLRALTLLKVAVAATVATIFLGPVFAFVGPKLF